ncbi:MFS transporter [Nitrososphaera viennensis]|uniref:Major facilitator superfamily transporter n=2 Tax=Nitrososphaera viennensis TaxID=1034015 RepID=A0A060HKQ1_9ARCH|nr:MFS transporter [Nitrososphaera viennensis]AIC16058.1 major facilitator superfamily transporter [Nitrososphaera viennensis EN76]UVS68027.1 MFS transporter [Nitrososphaera viennensis]
MDNDYHHHSSTTTAANLAASASLIIARIFYGANWFNVAAIFPLIALEFGQDVSLLGSISAAFLIGVGAFQVPSGIFAARHSPRTSAIAGIAVSSAAALVSGLISEAPQLVWLRFIVGAGMAFFFSSGVVLIARYANRNSPGLSIGVMNAAHSVGGIIGILGWIVIAVAIGWRQSLVLSGAIGLATALLLVLTIPKRETTKSTDGSPPPSSSPSDRKPPLPPSPPLPLNGAAVLKILSNHSIVALGLVLTGIQAAWALTLTFIVVFLQELEASLEIIGIIASVALISAIISAPLIGRVYDRVIRDARKILLICGAATSLATAAVSTAILPVIVAAVIVIGFFAGGAFTVAYAKARRTPVRGLGLEPPDSGGDGSASSNYSALNVAWVNGLSLLGVLWMPVAFSYAVQHAGGYPAAWMLAGVLTALFVTVPLLKVEK